MLSDLNESARRLEQQISSFEKLHSEELATLQKQLETYRQLQNDEMQMLRDQLNRLKDEIAAAQAQQPELSQPVTPNRPGITRRDFLVNSLQSLEPKIG